MRHKALEIALVLWVILTPIHPALATVAALPICDLLLACISAIRGGRKLTSHGFKRTVSKILVYEAAVILAFAAETWLTGEMIPCLKVVTALIGVTELKSCLEHLDALHGGSFFQSIADRLTPGPKPPSKGDL